MARLLLLNGPPGVGKSTVAARYADEQPGTLKCDVDVLRTFVSGWQADFEGAGARIRPAALALVAAYLREVGDVVVPQLLAREEELDKFVRAGTDAGARVVEVLLMADAETCVRRFDERGGGSAHTGAVRAAVEASGGPGVIRAYHAALLDLAARRPWTVVVEAGDGTVDDTFTAVMACLPRDA